MKLTYSRISLFSLHIEIVLGKKKIGNGTGFLYKPDGIDKQFLVTNYHIITASSPKSPESILNAYPDCPDSICFSVPSNKDFKPIKCGIPLFKEDNPKWLEHKDRSKGVDIVAIPTTFPQDCAVLNQSQLGLVEDINFEIGSDLFIVGFPHGFSAGDFLPIWKKGAVASEPLFEPEGLKRFYIDSFTKPGMSGSPVFASEKREIIYLDKHEEKLCQELAQNKITEIDLINKLPQNFNQRAQFKQFYQLVGIYSGRITDHDEKDPNIGIVWHKKLINELFNEPCVTEHPWSHTRFF